MSRGTRRAAAAGGTGGTAGTPGTAVIETNVAGASVSRASARRGSVRNRERSRVVGAPLRRRYVVGAALLRRPSVRRRSGRNRGRPCGVGASVWWRLVNRRGGRSVWCWAREGAEHPMPASVAQAMGSADERLQLAGDAVRVR